MDEGGSFSCDPLCAELEDLLLSALLATQPHNYAGELHDGDGPVPYYVVRAEREMRERMAVPLSDGSARRRRRRQRAHLA